MLSSLTRACNSVTKRRIQSLSLRQVAALEERLVSVVGDNVNDPLLQKSLRSLGWIDHRVGVSERSVQIQLRLPTLLHPLLSELKQDVVAKAQEELNLMAVEGRWDADLPSDIDVQVAAARPYPMMARHPDEHDELLSRLGPGLAHVAHYVAVYSCKGGVGKSTVAVNLAYELSRMGGRVGLLDVDIYGPSLPVLIHPTDATVRRSPLGRGMVLPIEHGGVKVLSLGFVSPDSGVPGSGPAGGAAVMRGPMAGRVVTQLLKGTDWGELDVLILDLPPGTGDVQLAVCQELQLSGAVAVTTPSKLAEVDTRKGIQLFRSMGVPTLAAVENMAYFDCEGGGRHFPFGSVNRDASAPGETMGLRPANVLQLPVSPTTSNANDTGSPLCLSRPEQAADELSIFEKLASVVSTELLLLQHSNGLGTQFTVRFEQGTPDLTVESVHLSPHSDSECFTVRLYSATGATEVSIPARELRCRHPETGELMEEVETKEASRMRLGDERMVQHHFHEDPGGAKLFPAKVEKKGYFGYSVEWADGSTIIYSMLSIVRASGGVVVDQSS